MSVSSDQRPLACTSPLGDDVLTLVSVQWTEHLGQPFEGSLELVSERDDIDALDLLGQSMTVRIGDADDTPAYLTGYVSTFAQIDRSEELCRYAITLVPWMELLRHVGGMKIFQEQTVVDIAKSIIADRGFSAEVDDRLTQVYRQRAYCVQYNESDFEFLSRLFEEEGIYYFFEYDDAQHTLVLCDDVSAHATVDGLAKLPYHEEVSDAAEKCVANWTTRREFSTASYVMRDYDFQKPLVDTTVRQNASDTPSVWSWYQFPGRYFETDDGQNYARVRSEAQSANEQAIEVVTMAQRLQAGCLLSVESHPLDAMNQEYLIHGCELTVSATDLRPSGHAPSGTNYVARLKLQSSAMPFRSGLTTPRPIMPGPQIATVVGPDGEEIWTDSFGRIKVQFAWDVDAVGDDSSSCWMRVTQPWTGKGWGAMSIPRVGEEVIVQFIDGDIDRPIVMGRVYNAAHLPPETLADAQAKTILRTRSTKGGDVDSFHELSFDDTKDAEQIYLHSERDFDRVVENNETAKIGFDKQDSGDQTVEIYNDQKLTVGVGSGEGSQTIEIGKDRNVTIDAGNDTLSIQQGDRVVTAAAGGVTIEAQTTLTLKCGGSTIELSPSGITIQASLVQIN